jgi:hypothetical protein
MEKTLIEKPFATRLNNALVKEEILRPCEVGNFWMEVIDFYTRTELSKRTDILSALAGLA